MMRMIILGLWLGTKMSNSDITILTVVENDCGILDLLISSIYKFTDPAPNMIICNNGGSKLLLSKYTNDSNINIVHNVPKLAGGSNRHSAGLNKIFPMVKTPKTAIIESDCILLRKDWDYLAPQHKILAAKKGEHRGNVLYHICFMIFETALLKGIDFGPSTAAFRTNRSYAVNEDVGWAIGTMVNPKDVGLMEFKDCKKNEGYYFGPEFQSDEIWVGTQPTVAHLGRGSNISGKAIRKGFDSPQKQLENWKKIAENIIR